MVILILILVLVAILLTVFQGFFAVLLACAMGSAGGLWILYTLVTGRLKTGLTSVLAAALLVGFCGGVLTVQIIYGIGGENGLAQIGAPERWIAYALVLALTASALLLAASFFEPPLVEDRHIVEMSWRQERFLWAAVIITVVAFARGNLTYEGAVGEAGTLKLDVFASLAAMLSATILPLAVIGVVQTSGWRRIRFSLIAVIGLLGLVPTGRRPVIYGLCIATYGAMRLSGRRMNLSAGRKAVLVTIGMVAVAISSYVFLGIRMAVGQMGRNNFNISMIWVVAEQGVFTDPRMITANLGDNLRGRSSNLARYLALLARGGDTPSPMYGKDTAEGVKKAIPDVFYRYFGANKSEVRAIATEEGVANEHFGLPVYDDANSILSSGIIDFGLPGLLVFPLLICAAWRLLLFFLDYVLNAEGQVVAVLFVLGILIQSEADIGGYIIAMRHLLTLLAIWAPFYWFPKLAGRRHEVPAFS